LLGMATYLFRSYSRETNGRLFEKWEEDWELLFD